MNCYVSGIVAIGLFCASLFTMTISKAQHEKLQKVLSPELDVIHTNIATERRNLYLQGLGLGLILSALVQYQYKPQLDTRFHRISLWFAITLGTALVYYLVMPKSDYMLKHLKTPEENQAWLSVYQEMQSKYIWGMIFGALIAIPVGNMFC
jgi:hypothetical protein